MREYKPKDIIPKLRAVRRSTNPLMDLWRACGGDAGAEFFDACVLMIARAQRDEDTTLLVTIDRVIKRTAVC